jgi:hypothetical protein
MSFLISLLVFIFGATPAWSLGPRPLETEEAWPIDRGTLQLSLGIEYQDDNILPFDTRGRDREVLRAPVFGAALGVSERVEIQAIYDLLSLDEDRGDDEYGSGDLRLFTKIGILKESAYPAVGLRFGTKLPNANRDDRLGTDETDFFASLLFSKNIERGAVHLNAGLAILGDPRPAGGQDDVFTYGFAVVVPTNPLELVVEINGQAFGQENNDRSLLRGGARWEIFEGVVLDAAGGIGLTDETEDWSVTGALSIYPRLF